MGIQTIAECVEDEAALKALTEIGVDYAQGFHVAKPMLLAEISPNVLPLRAIEGGIRRA